MPTDSFKISFSQSLLFPNKLPSPHFSTDETAKIDALVDEQQRLIDLLKEKRQDRDLQRRHKRALTRNAPMKPSGVAWLGGSAGTLECSALKRWISVLSGYAFSVK
jgi:type I restriction enzyme S subunit